MLVSFLNSLPPSLRIKCCSPPPSSSDDPAWFLSTYLLGDAVFLHPEFSPTYWSWDNPVFVHQLVLRWPFPSILRWPCFPPRGPENDLVFIHPEMALFSATRSWDDPVSLHPEMTLLSPPPPPPPWSWDCYDTIFFHPRPIVLTHLILPCAIGFL